MKPIARLFAALAVAQAAFVAPPVAATTYGSLVVFGDSLSDVGSNAAFGLYDPGQVVTGNTYVATSTYGYGTYSNGPVWPQYLAQMMGTTTTSWLQGGTNYANGGATMGTPGIGPLGYPFSLRVQSQLYLLRTGGVAPADALYVVAGGGNDARDAAEAISALDLGDPAQALQANQILTATATSVVTSLDAVVGGLLGAGAQHVVVWNLPNLGLTPEADTPHERVIAQFVASALNELIDALVASRGVTLFDLYDLSTLIAAYPAFFAYENVADACGAAAVGTDCNRYLWWDGVHPSTLSHAFIAFVLADQLGIGASASSAARLAFAPAAAAVADVPSPDVLALFAAALAAGLALSHRRAPRAIRSG